MKKKSGRYVDENDWHGFYFEGEKSGEAAIYSFIYCRFIRAWVSLATVCIVIG
jgi:hypothetical protein